MGSVGAKTRQEPLPDIFGGRLGERIRVADIEATLDKLSSDMSINPKYVDDSLPRKLYHQNCSLCTTAGALTLMGYDVEAMPRDETWRGPVHIFEVDYSNPDNYIASSGATQYTGRPVVKNTTDWKPIRDESGKLIRYEKVSSKNFEYYTPQNTTISTLPKRHTQYGAKNVPVMPKGADAATRAITQKVQGWGNGAFGEIEVKWHNGSGHSMLIANVKGSPRIYDLQNGKVYKSNDLEKLLKRTTANTTALVRLDNAKVNADSPVLKKMVKRRNTK